MQSFPRPVGLRADLVDRFDVEEFRGLHVLELCATIRMHAHRLGRSATERENPRFMRQPQQGFRVFTSSR